MAIVSSQMGPGQPSNYFLDNFVAHKISSLTECGAPKISMESSWLNTFVYSSVFTMTLPAKERAYVFNIIRRAEGAFSAYREARRALIEHVTTPRTIISHYFRSFLNFEVRVSQCWQGYELLMTAIGERKLFQKNDNSDMERLHDLYIDAKHLDRMIADKRLPDEATASLWITNQGLESAKVPSGLSFVELTEILISTGELAGKLSRRAAPNPDAPAS
jgi:hypothetical protein